MPLFTKNGSIPSEQTDGTEGWIPAPDKPDCPEGKEVVWLNWEWNVRDPRPVDRRGYQWNWVHDSKSWVESLFPEPVVSEAVEEAPVIEALTTEQLSALSTTQISSLTTEQLGGLSQ